MGERVREGVGGLEGGWVGREGGQEGTRGLL